MGAIKINVDLTKGELGDLIKSVASVNAKASNVNKDIIDTLKEEGFKKINTSLGASNYQAESPSTAFADKDRIGITGSQAIYDEFGTGTLGASTPHDVKSEFELNEYNSGSTIRENKFNKAIDDNYGGTIPPRRLVLDLYKSYNGRMGIYTG